MKYSVFIFAALVLLESGRIRNPVPLSLEDAHSACSKDYNFCKQWEIFQVIYVGVIFPDVAVFTFLWETKIAFLWCQRLSLRVISVPIQTEKVIYTFGSPEENILNYFWRSASKSFIVWITPTYYQVFENYFF